MSNPDAELVQNTRAKIAAKLATLPQVDQNGRRTSRVVTSPPTSGGLQSPVGIAATLGVNGVALLDSNAFLERVSTIDLDDDVALTAAVAATLAESPHLAAIAPAPTMAPNAAQGASSTPAPTRYETPRERIRAQLDKSVPSTDQVNRLL